MSRVDGDPDCGWPDVTLESIDCGSLVGKYPDFETTLTIPSADLAADVKSVNRLIAADPASIRAHHLADVRDWIADTRRRRD
jgi:hypothetical protein